MIKLGQNGSGGAMARDSNPGGFLFAVIGDCEQPYGPLGRIFIGNAVGSLSIAGITIGFRLMLAWLVICWSLCAAALISIKLGEEQQEAEQ